MVGKPGGSADWSAMCRAAAQPAGGCTIAQLV